MVVSSIISKTHREREDGENLLFFEFLLSYNDQWWKRTVLPIGTDPTDQNQVAPEYGKGYYTKFTFLFYNTSLKTF